MEKVAAWDIVVVRIALSLCTVSKDQSYNSLRPSNISSFSSPPLTSRFVQQLWKIKSPCKPAFCWPAGSLGQDQECQNLTAVRVSLPVHLQHMPYASP